MATWDDMAFGDNAVTEISQITLTLSDGVGLGMKAWLPCQQSEIEQNFPYFFKEEAKKWSTDIYAGRKQQQNQDTKTFPTILEYLPYHKDALTLMRDHNRHPWFCSHGYIILRIDLRGSGISSGMYFDEYEDQEMSDCLEILNWIENQPWSNKAVGMYGKSWGGFNGLQTAYKQPPSLKAVISLYSTDNRYACDMHYQGGTIIGNGMMSWASHMFTIDAKPPHPRYFPNLQAWKDFWLKRLQNASKSCLSSWLSHQNPSDPFWSHGSICKDFSKVKCPVLVIGGLTDSYTSAAFRMACELNSESRGIIGSWSHEWPDTSIFGPNIDYLNICLQWWNQHLKGEKSLGDVNLWPRLSLFCRKSFLCKDATKAVGKWIDLPNWNADLKEFQDFNYTDHSKVLPESLNILYLGSSMNLQAKKHTSTAEAVELQPHALQGAEAGLWLIMDSGFSGDQSIANKYSACWESEKLQTSNVFAGLSKLYLCVSSKSAGKYSIQVRICDQFPSGESTLVTKGCLNLCHSSDGWVSTYTGEKKIFCVNIDGTGHIFEPSHKILLSVSPTYFPSVYPAEDNKGLHVHVEESYLVFQTATNFRNDSRYSSPKPLLQLPKNEISNASSSLTTNTSPGGMYETLWKEDSGLVEYPTMNYTEQVVTKESFTTNEKVTKADISSECCFISNFKDEETGEIICTKVESRQDMGGCKQRISTKEHLKVSIDEEVFFEKHWDDNIPRKYV